MPSLTNRYVWILCSKRLSLFNNNNWNQIRDFCSGFIFDTVNKIVKSDEIKPTNFYDDDDANIFFRAAIIRRLVLAVLVLTSFPLLLIVWHQMFNIKKGNKKWSPYFDLNMSLKIFSLYHFLDLVQYNVSFLINFKCLAYCLFLNKLLRKLFFFLAIFGMFVCLQVCVAIIVLMFTLASFSLEMTFS